MCFMFVLLRSSENADAAARNRVLRTAVAEITPMAADFGVFVPPSGIVTTVDVLFVSI